jgi:hypothetical protein
MIKKTILFLITSFFCMFPGYAQESKPLLTFGMVTDIHYADIPDNGNRTYGKSLEKLRECIDTMNRYMPDFLIELGDFKDMSQPASEEKTLIYLYRAEKVFSGFRGPRYHVMGNHDVDCISKEQFNAVTENTGIDKALTYYSFIAKGITCIVLDANYDSTGKDFSKGQFEWGDPNIPKEELKWLKKQLRQSRGPVIVFCHQLLDSDDEYAVNNALEVRKVLEGSGKVAAVFQGHYHEGSYRFINGIHYHTQKALIEGEGPGNNSYSLVKVYPESVRVAGFRRAVSMTFNYSR